MQKLIRGLQQFRTEVFKQQKEFFEHLALGQHPEALFITCSDSRINPNLLTQTKPGELFIVRNAGNIVPPYGASKGGEGATIEYAVFALGVKDLIVCGHTRCGAMHAVNHPEVLEQMPQMQRWLAHAEVTRRIVKENYGHLDDEGRAMATIEENVLAQIENLQTHPVVAAALARRSLRLHAWVYKIETGEVFTYHPSKGQFVPISEGVVEAAESRPLRRLAAAV